MLQNFTRNWWTYALRGLAAVVFGILALTRTEQTLPALVLTFGAFALVDGITAIFGGIASRRVFEYWWAVVLEGVAGVIVGLLTFFWPGITALGLLYCIATWAVITGILEIVAAIEFRREIPGEGLLILGGLLSILCGVVLFVFPGSGALSVVWVIGIYALIFGISEIVLAFRLLGLQRKAETIGAR